MTVESAPPARGNNLDRVRQHNLATVLGLVHRAGPVSRSQLTRSTGLNRSTVGALVGELVTLGLVVESDPDSSNQVGRPSPIVSASPSVVAFAVNPEIDAVVVGVVTLGGVVSRRIRVDVDHVPTAAEAAAIAADTIERMRGELPRGTRTVGIGAAIPGLVRARDGLVRVAPHLDWIDEPFSEMLAAASGLPVVSANDANLGATAESVFGSGRGVDDIVYLNGGASGIGGGVITGGVPLGGVAGYAGEIGHTLVNSAGAACHCGASGCLETEVNRAALLDVLGLTSERSDELEQALAATIGPEADASDPAVRAEVERQLHALGVALRSVINIFNPELVVLGGFLGALYGVAPEVLDADVDSGPFRVSRESVRVVRTELGSNLLTVGAAELAFAPLLAEPAQTPLTAVHARAASA